MFPKTIVFFAWNFFRRPRNGVIEKCGSLILHVTPGQNEQQTIVSVLSLALLTIPWIEF